MSWKEIVSGVKEPLAGQDGWRPYRWNFCYPASIHWRVATEGWIPAYWEKARINSVAGGSTTDGATRLVLRAGLHWGKSLKYGHCPNFCDSRTFSYLGKSMRVISTYSEEKELGKNLNTFRLTTLPLVSKRQLLLHLMRDLWERAASEKNQKRRKIKSNLRRVQSKDPCLTLCERSLW